MPPPTPSAAQARHWRSASRALALLRGRAELTRRELGERLSLTSGGMSDLAGRLRAAGLIVESPAPVRRPGRPSSVWRAHPDAPVALAVDLRHGDWRVGQCSLDGEVTMLADGAHDGDPGGIVGRLRPVVAKLAAGLAGRLAVIGVAVPGQVSGTRVLQASMLTWRDVDLAELGAGTGVEVVAGNDATVAGVAEARVHAERPQVLLHVVVEVGLGGAVVVDGRPLRSDRDLHGEFGHLPLGDPGRRCPCGARGCWGLDFDAREVARTLGDPVPTDPRGYLLDTLARTTSSASVLGLRREAAASLGRGLAGLVNSLDPHAVTLGGLAGPVRRASPEAFEAAYADGLMLLHRERPPAVATATAGPHAVLTGIGLTALDHALDAEWLADWCSR
jgi:predicted NBD/HSP70 family sugar kinase